MKRRQSLQAAFGLFACSVIFGARQSARAGAFLPIAAPNWRALPWNIKEAQTEAHELDQGLIEKSWAYVDFWASWCAPCRLSFPFMNQLDAQFGKRGLKIIAISVDKDPRKIASFLKQNPANFQILWDSQGQAAKAFDLQAMPNAFLISPNQQIVMRHLGFRSSDAAELTRMIELRLRTS